jgi:hypothetical protein
VSEAPRRRSWYVNRRRGARTISFAARRSASSSDIPRAADRREHARCGGPDRGQLDLSDGPTRAAFLKTLSDPEFVAEARQASFDIDPIPGEEVERLIGELFRMR